MDGLFTREAWRLETLDYYHDPAALPRVPLVLAGKPVDWSPRAWWENWVRGLAGQGRSISRVHVVTEPLTDYVRYELEPYRRDQEAGQDARILPRPQALALGLPQFDYWLFDRERVAVMVYDPGAVMLRAELSDDPVLVRLCDAWRGVAMSNAIPLDEYTERQAAA